MRPRSKVSGKSIRGLRQELDQRRLAWSAGKPDESSTVQSEVSYQIRKFFELHGKKKNAKDVTWEMTYSSCDDTF